MTSSRKNFERTYRRYNLVFLLPLVLLIATLAPAYLFLVACHEEITATETARRLIHNGGYFLSAINNDETSFKLGLYRETAPDVALIGSSRLLEFRGQDFRGSFVNMGRTVPDLAQGVVVVDQMLAMHKPKLVIFGIDFWWFNSRWQDSNGTVQSFLPWNDGGWFPPTKASEVFSWLRTGALRPADLIRVLLHGAGHNYGVSAVIHGDGFDRYGSYHYRSMVEGRIRSDNEHFADELDRIANGSHRFEYGDHVDPQRWNQFVHILNRFQESGVPVITYMPPLPSPVIAAMKKSGQYAYVDEVRRRFGALSRWHLDVHDGLSQSIPDCEFIDGHHAGEIADRRILIMMANLKDSPLKPFVDIAALERNIQANAGRVVARDSPDHYKTEVDFLKLGCNKN